MIGRAHCHEHCEDTQGEKEVFDQDELAGLIRIESPLLLEVHIHIPPKDQQQEGEGHVPDHAQSGGDKSWNKGICPGEAQSRCGNSR